jgi:hypothetical protein
LVDVSAARSREAETSHRARVVTRALFSSGRFQLGSHDAGDPRTWRGPQALFTTRFVLDDDPDDDLDEDDEFGDDEEGEDEDEEDDDEDPDTETWQVFSSFEGFR